MKHPIFYREVKKMLSENFAYPMLMKYFERISEIPRGSYNEKAIADYIENFAKERNLECYKDSANNVFVRLPATKGYENEKAVLLQGHTDMVCEKNEGVQHDFEKDPLKLYEKDGWIRAEGTTLGADNGVAVAMMLYILDGAEGNLGAHPTIECLFTASEEVGLDGVKSFDYSLISARQMINMDSADESMIIAGCAGGIRSSMTFDFTPVDISGETLLITLKGLAGGHSGEDINRGRANANKLMSRVLLSLSEKVSVNIVSFMGGSKDNAIPREATAIIATDDIIKACEVVDNISSEIKAELGKDDVGFSLNAKAVDCESKKMLNKADTDKIIFFGATVANGIFEMNKSIDGLVEFSRNFGISCVDTDNVELVFSTRSSIDSQIDHSISQLDSYAKMLGGKVRHYSRYPGWNFAERSEIREKYSDEYYKRFGEKPSILVIHAGLECGIIKENIPDMDIISCGPIILDLHSPDEALDKVSFEKFCGIIIGILNFDTN